MLKKSLALLLAIVLAMCLPGCSAPVLTDKQQLFIINEVASNYDMEFEVMNDLPEEPLHALFILDGDQKRLDTTEYFDTVLISSKNIRRHYFVSEESKTMILFSRFQSPPELNQEFVVLDNTTSRSIRHPEDEIGAPPIQFPLHNKVDRATLPENTWTVYLLWPRQESCWTCILKIEYEEQLSFLLAN